MEKPRALIVGAAGFLGSYLVQAAEAKFEVVRGERVVTGPGVVAMDITDAASVARALGDARPDVVVLVAAMSDIDRCEAEPKQAFAVNARGAEIVANVCARMNARLMFTSTGAVFDGRKHGYREEDELSPLSVYGRTKAEAEKAVRALTPAALVVRFSLVIGFGQRAGTNSMMDSLRNKWKAGIPVIVPAAEVRNPIHAESLSMIMVRLLADGNASGVYHIGASDSISRYELARRLAARAGVAAELVQPQIELIPGRAPRGQDHFLLTEKLEGIYGMESPSCEQEIARCFHGVA